MNKKYKKIKVNFKRILLIFVVVFFIAISYWFYCEANVPSWTDLEINSIRLNNVDASFSVKNGSIFKNGKKINKWLNTEEYDRVLRLVLFLQWNKEDPLLISTEFDIQKIDPILDQLTNYDKELFEASTKNVSKYSPLESDNILRSNKLHPIEFIKSFLNSSQKYQNFTNDISEEKAKEFTDALYHSLDLYQAESDEILVQYAETLEKSKFDDISYFAGKNITNAGIIRSDLEKIKKNANLLKIEIDKRNDCLNASQKKCLRIFDNTKTKKTVDLQDDDRSPRLLTHNQLNISKDEDVHGPYLIKSDCWGNKNEYMYYSTRCSSESNCMEWSHLADNAYYSKYNINTDDGKFFASKNIEYLPQNATAPYGCGNLEYKTNLATLDFFYKNFKENKLFDYIDKNLNITDELKDIIQLGIKKENDFFSSKYPSQEKLDQLGEYYLAAYNLASKKNELEGSDREELLRRYNLIRERFSLLDNTLNRILFHEKNYIKNSDQIIIPIPYLYSSRSNYSIFFLNFSHNVWRSDDQLKYMENGSSHLTDNNTPFIDYDKAVENFGAEKLQEWMNIVNEYRKE